MTVLSFNNSAASAKFIGAALGAIALSACSVTGNSGRSLNADGEKANYEEAIGAFTSPAADPTQGDPVAAAAFWGTKFQQQPDETEVVVNYSAALRKIGSVEEAVKIITAATNRNDSSEVKLEAGKALIEGGRAFEAVRYLKEASEEMPNNWSALSSYGVALDQIGEHDTAQLKYDQALALAPNSTIVMNNKGLSYAMSGDLGRAVATLRHTVGMPGSDARMRQNLALALALKGDLREAERLARSDLPPQIADRNIDYFRSLLNQPAYWQDYAAEDFDTPQFDQPVAAAAPLKAAPAPKTKPALVPTETLSLREEVTPVTAISSEPVSLTGATPVTDASWDEVPVLKDAADTAVDAAVGTPVPALIEEAADAAVEASGASLKD